MILLECVKQNETEALEDEFLSGLLSCPEVGKMPRKPDVPCRYPGCSRLIPAGERYCDEHRSKVNSDYEKYGRDKAAKRKYGRAWKQDSRPIFPLQDSPEWFHLPRVGN